MSLVIYKMYVLNNVVYLKTRKIAFISPLHNHFKVQYSQIVHSQYINNRNFVISMIS